VKPLNIGASPERDRQPGVSKYQTVLECAAACSDDQYVDGDSDW